MYINCGIPDVDKFIGRMLWGVKTTIFSIAFFWKRRTQSRIEKFEDFSCVLQGLK
jgi:hypothetical protein